MISNIDQAVSEMSTLMEDSPSGNPGRESRNIVRSQDGSPEIGPTTRWDGRHDLGHTQSDEHGEETDDNPSNGHDTRAAGRESIFEEGGDASDDTDNGEGDAEIMDQRPIALQLLLVPWQQVY